MIAYSIIIFFAVLVLFLSYLLWKARKGGSIEFDKSYGLQAYDIQFDSLSKHGPFTIELKPNMYLYNIPITKLKEPGDIRISVLTPSRSRPELLRKSLNSLVETAANPDNIQIIIRSDLDDNYMKAFGYSGCKNIKILRGQRMKGYGSLHYFYTECAMHSSGDLLLLWNDDAKMLTKNWDVKLWEETALQREKGTPGFWALSNNHWPFAFPVVTRSVIESLGAFARFSYNDAYIHELAKACNLVQPVLECIRVQHDMPPVSGWDGESYDLYKAGFFKDIIEADAKLLIQ